MALVLMIMREVGNCAPAVTEDNGRVKGRRPACTSKTHAS